MALTETLVTTIGVSVAKALLGVWLKDHPLAQAAGKSVLDIIKTKTPNFLAARKAAREFESLADRVGASLSPVFKSYELSDSSYEAVSLEVASAISDSNIDAKLLAGISFNPHDLHQHILKSHPEGDQHFSEVESALYRRSLDLAAQYLVDLAPSLPKYTSQTFTEILTRFDTLTGVLYEILEDLDELRASSDRSNDDRQFSDFERDYRAAIIRRFDRLHLFGADVSRRTKRYQLSIQQKHSLNAGPVLKRPATWSTALLKIL